MFVGISAGQTAFRRMFTAAEVAESARTRPTSPVFAAQYWGMRAFLIECSQHVSLNGRILGITSTKWRALQSICQPH